MGVPKRHDREGKIGIAYTSKRYNKGGVVKFANHSCRPDHTCELQESASGRVYLVAVDDITKDVELTFPYEGAKTWVECWCAKCKEARAGD